MNESIRHRELTMTVICKSCEHQYGGWRPRCPACGTDTPVKAVTFNTPRVAHVRPRKEIKACAFCRLGVEKKKHVRCPVCNELVHKTCLGLHRPDCEQYQQDVAAESAKLQVAS